MCALPFVLGAGLTLLGGQRGLVGDPGAWFLLLLVLAPVCALIACAISVFRAWRRRAAWSAVVATTNVGYLVFTLLLLSSVRM